MEQEGFAAPGADRARDLRDGVRLLGGERGRRLGGTAFAQHVARRRALGQLDEAARRERAQPSRRSGPLALELAHGHVARAREAFEQRRLARRAREQAPARAAAPAASRATRSLAARARGACSSSHAVTRPSRASPCSACSSSPPAIPSRRRAAARAGPRASRASSCCAGSGNVVAASAARPRGVSAKPRALRGAEPAGSAAASAIPIGHRALDRRLAQHAEQRRRQHGLGVDQLLERREPARRTRSRRCARRSTRPAAAAAGARAPGSRAAPPPRAPAARRSRRARRSARAGRRAPRHAPAARTGDRSWPEFMRSARGRERGAPASRCGWGAAVARCASTGRFASWWTPGSEVTGGVWDALAAPVLLLPPARRRSLLVLGLAGGSVARVLRALAPRRADRRGRARRRACCARRGAGSGSTRSASRWSRPTRAPISRACAGAST